MNKVSSVLILLAIAACFVAAESEEAGVEAVPRVLLMREESETPMPGLTYGQSDELSLPKIIFFGAGVDNIIADAETWARRGVQAFFVDYVAREWSTDIWARDGKPWTIGESDETLQEAKQAAAICNRIGSETFLKISFDHCFEWFNDVAWQRIDNNFRQFAIFAREADFTGIALDIEYVGEQYSYDWEGYTYDGYTREDLVDKIDERMTRVIQILYDEFPDMVFLTFPEQGLGLGNIIHCAWIEEAARRDAPEGIHYCMESTYRCANIRYALGHAWLPNVLFHKALSKRATKYWMEKCTIAAGFWPFGSDDVRLFGPTMDLEAFRQGYAATLMMSPRYSWIYGSYCQEQCIGRELEKYTGDKDINAYLDVLTKRDVVTTPKYVALAKELRRKALRDYSADLGVLPTPQVAAPDDKVRVGLMPKNLLGAGADERSTDDIWDLGLRLFHGEVVDLKAHFNTQTDWMIIGPFPSPGEFEGHHTVFPPEQEIDLSAEYEGVEGKVRWTPHRQAGSATSVNFKSIYEPTEHVTAYALCYVTAPQAMDVQIRLGTNDAGKMWVGGKLVYDYPFEGTAILDRDVAPVTLPEGTTPILLKITNGLLNWGFVFRITDAKGEPIRDLKFSTAP